MSSNTMTQNALALNNPENLPHVILASGSPRRKELLESLGVAFDLVLPTVDEKSLDVSHLPPENQVLELAKFKGESVAKLHPQSLVVAADTIVVLNRTEILEKPQDTDDAFKMLNKLQGTCHSVFSAIAIFYKGNTYAEMLETKVWMRGLSEKDIRTYIATGEPMDKAGSYAIQGQGSVLIEKIEGCYFNVVGMSLILLDKLVSEAISQ